MSSHFLQKCCCKNAQFSKEIKFYMLKSAEKCSIVYHDTSIFLKAFIRDPQSQDILVFRYK